MKNECEKYDRSPPSREKATKEKLVMENSSG
jgi:hypothetical protein